MHLLGETNVYALSALLVLAALWLMFWIARRSRRKKTGSLIPTIHGPSTFTFEVVGESHYQAAFAEIFGAPNEDGYDELCLAKLVFEDDNPHDSNAVSVSVNGRKVGYLSREAAKAFRARARENSLLRHYTACQVAARVRGGWKSGQDSGMFGIKLDLPES